MGMKLIYHYILINKNLIFELLFRELFDLKKMNKLLIHLKSILSIQNFHFIISI